LPPGTAKKDFNTAYNQLKNQIIKQELAGDGVDPITKLALPE
jgi:hypothetical protein